MLYTRYLENPIKVSDVLDTTMFRVRGVRAQTPTRTAVGRPDVAGTCGDDDGTGSRARMLVWSSVWVPNVGIAPVSHPSRAAPQNPLSGDHSRP